MAVSYDSEEQSPILIDLRSEVVPDSETKVIVQESFHESSALSGSDNQYYVIAQSNLSLSSSSLMKQVCCSESVVECDIFTMSAERPIDRLTSVLERLTERRDLSASFEKLQLATVHKMLPPTHLKHELFRDIDAFQTY